MIASSVACIGECMIELSGEDGPRWSMGFAGDTFNTAWCLRALLDRSDRVDFVSAFGDDAFSTRQRAFFDAHGIGTAASPVLAGERPGLYAITLEGAERSFTYWRSDSAARHLADDAASLAASFHGKNLLYLSGITLAILDDTGRRNLITTVAQARQQQHARIVFDPNYRARLWPSAEAARQAFAQMLEHTDIALPTFPDEAELQGDRTPAATIARFQAAGVSEIVVKNGADNAHLASGEERHVVAAPHVANPVDTTGAGDSFNGAYLAARLQGMMPNAAVGKAHNVAAMVICRHGALAPHDELKAAYDQ